MESSFQRQKQVKTYGNPRKNASNSLLKSNNVNSNVIFIKRVALTTKNAVELMLSGTLKSKVCRYCLHVTYPLSELDQIMQIAGHGALYKVTIRDIVASVHPFKVVNNPNLPNKICEKCINQALQAYLFAQQCEQSERALRNCFEDVYERFDKLDPLEKPKKRGRQKLRQNHNVIKVQHRKVIDYAEPIRNLINVSSVSLTKEPQIGPLECRKCWQVLPNIESLANHEQIHPKSMWYHCRLCGKAYAKKYQMSRHVNLHSKGKLPNTLEIAENKQDIEFVCKHCGDASENYDVHLQHSEKHNFKMLMEHLVEKKMDKLCAVCLNKKGNMIQMDKLISLHGGYPELTGDRTLYNILGSTLPEMNIAQNHTGTKICENCLDNAISTYIFINKAHYVRNRLDTCVTTMLNSIKEVQPENKLFIEIAQNGIMPITESFDDNLLLDDNEVDVNKLKVDVLEDEFRMKSEDESSSEDEKPNVKEISKVLSKNTKNVRNKKLENSLSKISNGFNFNSDNLGEFLTFKKKDEKTKKATVKYTCPMCNKHFVSDYFLTKHVLRHVNKKVDCKLCWSMFKSKFYLHEHIKMCHKFKLKSFSVCQTCGRTFRCENKKLKHEEYHKSILCALCSKTFTTQKLYNSHMQKHVHNLKKYTDRHSQSCSFCEQIYSNDNDLSVHVNKVHLQIKPYSCDMCEKQFYTEQNLKNHKKGHVVLCKEKCEFCSKYLKCRKHLVIHIRKHLGVKPYKCVICTESFYSEFKVKQHMKKWHGGTYCCKLCRKVFVTRKGLKSHINTAHSIF